MSSSSLPEHDRSPAGVASFVAARAELWAAVAAALEQPDRDALEQLRRRQVEVCGADEVPLLRTMTERAAALVDGSACGDAETAALATTARAIAALAATEATAWAGGRREEAVNCRRMQHALLSDAPRLTRGSV